MLPSVTTSASIGLRPTTATVRTTGNTSYCHYSMKPPSPPPITASTTRNHRRSVVYFPQGHNEQLGEDEEQPKNLGSVKLVILLVMLQLGEVGEQLILFVMFYI
ncbi:hypothetical protein L1987_02742 [Smallanthus sonchifolius]|uniref:Uncharacterized protein n=1 Tax=Smallanthus sonchifolius TaxID=185202 RepID=A0ACB9K8W6_9ASTR|nr:hypothetical protein L1987_02742 [Smallanthus sonchifolius]